MDILGIMHLFIIENELQSNINGVEVEKGKGIKEEENIIMKG